MSLARQSQARTTWASASTRSVDVSGTKFVYRQLGADSGVPLIFLNHLAAELDRWDPRVVDGVASRRPRDRLRQSRRRRVRGFGPELSRRDGARRRCIHPSVGYFREDEREHDSLCQCRTFGTHR